MTDPPVQLGRYTLAREFGRGGMSVVFLARDARLDRDVAIKALPEHLANDPDRLSRFQREAKVLASLNHPSIGAITAFKRPTASSSSLRSGLRAAHRLLAMSASLNPGRGRARRRSR